MAKILNIEIETARLRVAETDSRGTRLYQCFSLPVPRGAVDDGQVRDTKTLGSMLKTLLEEKKIRTKKVFFAAGSSRIASREVRIPLIKKSQIQAMIQENATEYFPIDISNYVISYNIIDIETTRDKNNEELKQYHLMVYAAPTAISTALREFAEAANLNITGITYTGDSIYSAVKENYGEGVHMLIKTEMSSTSISIIRNGELALQRNINHGIDSAVEAVQAFPQFGEDLDEQDALDVLNDRLCIYDSLDGVRPVGEEDELLVTAKNEVTESFRYMIGNISRIIDYYISRNTDVNFTSINLCGLGAGVRGLNILLANEIGQRVEIVYALAGCICPDFPKHEGLYLYTAVIAPAHSGVNLLEKTSRRKKEEKGSLSGAILICAVGVIAGVALAGAGIVNRIYQQHIYDHLNERITEESSVQDIYDAYMAAKDNYGNYENMYAKTNTPNENLRDFLEEMEQKMPSDMTVESFTSTGTGVIFTLRTSGKSEAATVLIQLRTFESLATVTTTGLDEDENGNVAMTVSCTYSEPAGLDLEESE